MTSTTTLVLASRSATRIALLRSAGLTLTIDPADVDEDSIGAAVADPAGRAMALAHKKAQVVSARHPGALVIGGDQVCTLAGADGPRFLEKPTDPEDHVLMLLAMAGRTHTFFPAAVLVKDGVVHAEIHESVRVVFRDFDERTARAYVASGEGKGSCGGYESEHRGAQLIAHIDGTQHAVLGLPLLGILAALRTLAASGVVVDGLL